MKPYVMRMAVLLLTAVTWAGAAEDPTVVVVRPELRDVQLTTTLPGNIEPFEIVQVHARATGYVEDVLVDIGDGVTEGQVLARLTIPEMTPDLARARAELKAAQARLVRARAAAELAATEARRMTESHARLPGAVPAQDVDIAVAQRKVADADVAVRTAEESLAAAAVTRLEVLMSYATIRAPFDGVVTHRMVHTGALAIQGDESGDPLFTVLRIDRMRLAIDVPERVAPLVEVGEEMTFTVDALPGRSFGTEVARTVGGLSPASRRMRVEGDISQPTGCRPGMYATVTLAYESLTDALAVPSRSLRTRDGVTFVLVAINDVLEQVPVSVVEEDGVWALVNGSGLSSESAVVVDGPPGLLAGQRVRPRWEGDGP